MILAGPDVPEGVTKTTNVSLVDVFPTILEAVGVPRRAQDETLPGESLWQLAREPDRSRIAFSEYHTIGSSSGVFMVRDARYKYIHYVDFPPQLFDLENDPDELNDLADDPSYGEALQGCEEQLRAIIDPEAVDARAKEDQRRRIEAHGGLSAVLAEGEKIPWTPAPSEFEPAPVFARDGDIPPQPS